MEIKEQQPVTSFQNITIGYECDICKKKVEGKERPKDWHHFEHHHEQWGNDSGDSYDWFDVCSPKCYFAQLEKSLKEMDEYYTAKIDDKSPEFVKSLLSTIK